jgi:hypothetical protein
MPIVLYDASQLHPDDLNGILESETQLCGIVNNYPVRRSAVPFEPMDIYANDDRTLRVYVKTPDLNIVNLTGAQGLLTVKTDKDATSAVITKTTASETQGEIGSADQGEMFFYLVPTDTASLPIRQYVYDVKVTLSTGKKYTVLEGVINLIAPVGLHGVINEAG